MRNWWKEKKPDTPGAAQVCQRGGFSASASSFFGRFNKGGKTDVDSEQRVLCEADNKRQVEGMHTVQLCEKGECYLTPRASGNALTSLSSCRNNINRAQFE